MSSQILLEDVSNWKGAAPDRSCFYSSSSSIAQKDWLPILSNKFRLHLNPDPVAEKQFTQSLLPRVDQKHSGFTHNTKSYVCYSKIVDERFENYSRDAFLTEKNQFYTVFPRGKEGRSDYLASQIVSHDINDSGFTRLPAQIPSKPEFITTESRVNYGRSRPAFHRGNFNKASIAASGSAYVNDITHVQIGLQGTSPFERNHSNKPPLAYSNISKTSQIKADAYTRLSERGVLLTSSVKLDEALKKPIGDGIKTVIGPKEDTGSTKNNIGFKSQREDNPKRFSTESFRTRPQEAKTIKDLQSVGSIGRTGFSLCNEFKKTNEAEPEEKINHRLHPLVADRRMRQIRLAYKPLLKAVVERDRK